jgi:hypothetical protein
MLARLLGALFGTKATAVGGALLVASALVTSSAQSTDASPDADPFAEVVAAVVSAPPSPAPFSVPAITRAPEAVRMDPAAPPATAASPSPAACVVDAQARDTSLERIRSAFASSRASLDRIAADRTRARSAATLERASTMLSGVDRAAEELVSGAAACAADIREVTDRTVHAMEMIVDLARSATTPTPTPQPTKKPEPTKKHR